MSTGAGWPQCGNDLIAELVRFRGRLGLIADDQDELVASAIAALTGRAPCRAGSALLVGPPPTSAEEIIDHLVASSTVIIDIDLLFWRPWLSLNPLAVIRTLARRRPGSVVSWPGTISHGHASYSHPGRRDRYEASLDDAVILRPALTIFPDDTPFRIERIP